MRDFTQPFINIRTHELLLGNYPQMDIIRGLLALNSVRITELARNSGVRPGAFYDLLKGYRKDPRAMGAISRALGIPSRELFPPEKNGNGRTGSKHDGH